MDKIKLGGIEIARVLEDDQPIFSPWTMYPNSSPADLERERSWLMPRFYNETRELLESTMHSYVFRTHDHTILIDTCVGNDKPGLRRDSWRKGNWPYLENLAVAGYAPEDIDLVLLTHLHVDHVGWNTRLVDGRWEPTFPNARYVFSEIDLDSLKTKHESGDGQNVNVFEDGIRFEPAPGHTPGQFDIRILSDGAEALVTGDVFHHPIQAAHPAWNSWACEHKPTAKATRQGVFEDVADRDVLVMPAHFEPCKLRRGDGGFRFAFD